MTTPLLGIDKWVSSIRNRMANDPGRQDLEDHILCNGFLFLQEYWQDILHGTKAEPIIELTKTPGRRRDVSKKENAATKGKRFFESPEKENIDIFSRKPTSPFQPLEKQERITESNIFKPTKLKNVSRLELTSQPRNFRNNGDEEDEQAVEILVTPPSASMKKSDLEISPTALRSVKFSSEPETIGSNPKHGDMLSIIAEGDEQEALPAVASPRKGLIIGERVISYQIPKDPDDPDGPMATITVPYSEDDRSFDDSEPTSTINSFPIDPYARDYETHELPKIIAASPKSEEKPPTPVPAPALVRKASVPVFPILPPPSPIRKARESVEVSNAVSVKPVNNGGRTSWLQKARDVTAKHGVKRKSDEMVEDRGRSTESLEKVLKIARTEDNNTGSSLTDKVPPKPVIQPFRPVTKPRDLPPPSQTQQTQHIQQTHLQAPHEDTEGMMDVLKRTVEGLGARVGKGLGKSLGGAAANAAAVEAKAAAEARLAQREAKGSDGARQSRPSVSELVGVYESGPTSDRNSRESYPRPLGSTSPIAPRLLLERTSVTSTSSSSPPPAAPIRIVSQNSIPQFQVQRPPLKEFVSSQPESQGYSQPSTQSTYVSNLFDDNPTWTQSSFATEYTATQTFSQSQSQGYSQPYQADTIDSQPTLPPSAESQHPQTQEHTLTDVYHEVEEEEELVLGQDVVQHVFNSQPTESKDNQIERTASQSSEDKPQGFVAQASSMISKVMGSATLKRLKPEPVKSIQLAAAAAKKQQEEAEKKAARLKEMEKRRAVIASKKAEQDATEKSKLQKRDREDDTTKTLKKTDDDTMKKRKVVVEIEKKPVRMTKPPSKDKVSSVSTNAGVVRPLPKATQTPLPPTGSMKVTKQTISALNQPEFKTPMPASSSKLQASQSKSHIREAAYDDTRQPSETLQAQMHARIQAQIAQAKQRKSQEPPIPSESIELPDINSEYSNSDDEDRPRTFDPPDWAQSPVLAQALQSQSRLNPDDIFGPVRPLRMDEIFKKNTSRFRARTSSANWAGTDELTKEEEKAYAKRMGYVEF